MKIELFLARGIQYFELVIFSFKSYLYYLTRSFIASKRPFYLPTRAFNVATRAVNLATHAFNLAARTFIFPTRGFELLTRGFELLTRGFELVTRGFELLTRGLELVTCVLLLHGASPNSILHKIDINRIHHSFKQNLELMQTIEDCSS